MRRTGGTSGSTNRARNGGRGCCRRGSHGGARAAQASAGGQERDDQIVAGRPGAGPEAGRASRSAGPNVREDAAPPSVGCRRPPARVGSGRASTDHCRDRPFVQAGAAVPVDCCGAGSARVDSGSKDMQLAISLFKKKQDLDQLVVGHESGGWCGGENKDETAEKEPGRCQMDMESGCSSARRFRSSRSTHEPVTVDLSRLPGEYRGIDWMIGKAKITNWQATAKTWILRAAEIETKKQVRQNMDNLHTTNIKNFNDPL